MRIREIESHEVAATLRSSRSAVPLGIDSALVQQTIVNLETEKRTFGTDSTESKSLNQRLEDLRIFLKPEVADALDNCDVFVLPLDICLAFSQYSESDDHGQIILTTGMIKLIEAEIHDSWVQNRIPEELQNLPVGRVHQNLMLTLNTASFLLRARYYLFGEKLPNFQAAVDHEGREHSVLASSGALMFLVLHELGHIELKHLNGKVARFSHYDMAYEQSLSDYQLQEAEADDYALNAVIDQAKPLTPFWLSQCLSFFVNLELLTGIIEGSHPLAINRIYGAELKRKDSELSGAQIVTELGKRFSEIQLEGAPGGDRPLITTPRAQCIGALCEVIDVLRFYDIDLSALTKNLN